MDKKWDCLDCSVFERKLDSATNLPFETVAMATSCEIVEWKIDGSWALIDLRYKLYKGHWKGGGG